MPQIGWRREALLLLPIAAIALIGLLLFVLFSYRNVVVGQVEQTRAAASRAAGRAYQALAGWPKGREALYSLVPEGGGLALVDADGLVLASAGRVPESGLLTPLGTGGPPPDATHQILIGPDRGVGSKIVVFAQLPSTRGSTLWLRLDYPAPLLGGHLRALPLLIGLALALSVLLFVLTVLFLRHLLRPFDEMLRRAQALREGDGPTPERELEFLMETFDRALAALSEPAAESELAALERTLGYSLNTGVLILDENRRCVSLNARGAALLGLEQVTPEASCALDALLAPHRELRELMLSSLERGEALERVECAVNAGGVRRTIGLTLGPLRRPDGSVRGWIALFADLTKVLEEARQQRVSESLETLAELTAGLAHEMRNALASLRGYVTLLQRKESDGGAGDDLAQIRTETDQLHRLLEDFLSFARPGQVSFEPVALGRLLHRAAADPALGGAAVRVVATPELERATIQGDLHLLQRALRNLLLNAVEAQRGPAQEEPTEPIVLRAAATDDQILLSIEDRGVGIPPDRNPDLLFRPFASGRPEGVGLGLSISRRIADLHNAQLTLANREGGGVRAELAFPRGRSEPPRSVAV